MMQLANLKRSLFEAKALALRPNSSAFVRGLRLASQLDSDQLQSLSWQRRKAIVEFAFQEVPFYRAHYSASGYENGDLKSPKDFERLPPLEKHHILTATHELFRRGLNASSQRGVSTGGTTGVPLTVYRDRSVVPSLISWRGLARWGVHPSDNSGYLYRAIPQGARRLASSALLYPTRRFYLSATGMTDETMSRFHQSVAKAGARYLVGYVGAIEEFARFCDRRELALPHLKAIWTTAAPLPTTLRRYIGEVFEAPVYTQYGSCEFYWIGSECKCGGGMHIETDIRHVEAVDTNGSCCPDGIVGDLLVTDLLNHTFPLIRYRLGDRGAVGLPKCPCGEPFPKMDYVQGRTSDAIVLPNGRRIPGEFFTTIFDDFTADISGFRVVQREDFSIAVYFRARSGAASGAAAQVHRSLLNITEHLVPVVMLQTEELTHLAGKTRFVESAVRNVHQDAGVSPRTGSS